MRIVKSQTRQDLGPCAAGEGAALIRDAIAKQGHVAIIVATGSSQFEMLEALAKQPDIRWDKVVGFHLDDYVGLPITHPASFRLYLWQRFLSKLPLPMGAFNYVNAESNAKVECERLGALIRPHPIDVAFIGIGENAHIAFNDPPANFETEEPYIVVELDHACRQQQFGEGWFPTFADVPTKAISMSVRQIMKSRAMIVTVPDERKAKAVRDSVEGPVTPTTPASILQQHRNATLHVDAAAGSLLSDGM
jgi:glucosamine-6-phosphate deaminase